MSSTSRNTTLDVKFVVLALIWMALIFAFSAQPKNEIPEFGAWDLLVKKGGHFLEYAVLAWLWQRALDGRPLAIAWSIAVAYAASDELHQLFVAGRNACLMDVGIDAIGAGTGLLVVCRHGQRVKLWLKAAFRFVLVLFDG